MMLLLSILGIASGANAQESMNLTIAETGAQVAPRIESKAGRVYAAYIRLKQLSNGDIMFRSRGAGEQMFSSAVAVTNTGKINATLQRGPEFVVTPDGTIHMVWMEARVGTNPDIYYSRGTENGTKWSAPVDISVDQQRATQDFPSIAADSAGNIFVAWIDNRDLIDGKLENDQIYTTRSTDGGTNWSAPKRASFNPGDVGGSCECCRTSIAATPDGDVLITYRVNMDNRRDIFVSRSRDMGVTFQTAIRVQTKPWMIMACPATGPMTALDKKGNLHIVYRSAASGEGFVYYNLLMHNASQTFVEMKLSSTGSANNADIAVSENGALSAVYESGSNVVERRSYDGGNSWTQEIPIDEVTSTKAYPTTTVDHATSKVLTVWQDDRRDKNDVMLLECVESGGVMLPGIEIVSAVVQTDSVWLTWRADRHGATYFEITDGSVIIITLDTSIVIPSLWLNGEPLQITPISAIGRGQPRMVSMDAGVREPKPVNVQPSKQMVTRGEQISIDIDLAHELRWDVYDILGKRCASLNSKPMGDGHALEVPELSAGVYQLHCESAGLLIKLIIRE
jgi:hypothetical protein